MNTLKLKRYIWIPLLICIVFIIGCTTNSSDQLRQEALSAELIKNDQITQRPKTFLSPPEYYVCGNNLFPCRTVNFGHCSTFTYHDGNFSLEEGNSYE